MNVSKPRPGAAFETRLHLEILPQPDDTTCGPTCLKAVYGYYGDPVSLDRVIREVPTLPGGGTLAVLLGCHALARGYRATIQTFDLQVFDPTWFGPDGPDMAERLRARKAAKSDPKLHCATDAYLEFLDRGGRIEMRDLTASLIRGLLKRDIPILTGLSATYLYGTARERDDGGELIYDDVGGEPSGHFVVLCGYHVEDRLVRVADPLMPNPISERPIYRVHLNRLILSIMLGSLTFDANLLVIRPPNHRKHPNRRPRSHVIRHRRH